MSPRRGVCWRETASLLPARKTTSTKLNQQGSALLPLKVTNPLAHASNDSELTPPDRITNKAADMWSQLGQAGEGSWKRKAYVRSPFPRLSITVLVSESLDRARTRILH